MMYRLEVVTLEVIANLNVDVALFNKAKVEEQNRLIINLQNRTKKLEDIVQKTPGKCLLLEPKVNVCQARINLDLKKAKRIEANRQLILAQQEKISLSKEVKL